MLKKIARAAFDAAARRYNPDHLHALPIVVYRHDLGDYMRRWILMHPLGTVRLHHIRRPDADADYHTHPFDFASLILSGWYTEQTPSWTEIEDTGDHWMQMHRYEAGDVNVSIGDAPHRIANVSDGGVWTLVISGPKVRQWGFVVPGPTLPWRFVPWEEYVSRKQSLDVEAYRRRIDEVTSRLEGLRDKVVDLQVAG